MNLLLGKKHHLFAALLFAAAPTGFAQMLVQYDLTGATPLAPSTVASGITAGNVTTGYSWVWSTKTTGLQINAGASVTTPALAVAQGAGYYASFTLSSASPMDLTSLTFNGGYGSFSSPAGLALETSVDGYASYMSTAINTALPSFESDTISLTAAQFQGLTSITFRLYGYNAAYGSEQMNDLTVNGSVVPVPEPNALTLAGMGIMSLFGLKAWRRRH